MMLEGKIIFVSLLISLFGLKNFAQEFKAPELWDARGNVKQIKYKSKDPLLTFKSMKFDKDGKLKNSMIVYNSDGLPEGINLNFGPLSFNVDFTFSDNRLVAAKMVREKPYPLEMDVQYVFENGVMTKESAVTNYKEKKDQLNYVLNDYSFSNYKYDNNGNWVSRNVELTNKNVTTGKLETITYTETREINYW